MGQFWLWYRNHSSSEQRFIALLALALAAAVLYYAAWIPGERKLEEARQAYAQQQELLAWLQQNAPLVGQIPATPLASADAQPLPALLSSTAGELAIPFDPPVQEGGKVTITLAQVSFNQLLRWLDKLQQEHQVAPRAATITKTTTPGAVNATLQFSR